jgi:hypothetical protein
LLITALADLLAPHCVIEAFGLEQFFMAALFGNPTPFQNVNAVRV